MMESQNALSWDTQELPSPTRVAVSVFVTGDREKAWISSHVESRIFICKKYSGLFISTCGSVSVVLQFLQCSLWDREVFEGQSHDMQFIAMVLQKWI